MANIFTFQENQYHTGDTVRVHLNVKEGDKDRVQIFEGLIISVGGSGAGKSITVRKIGSNAIGVERLIPLQTPNLLKIELKTAGNVRRAKLYYLRDRIGRKATKVKTKIVDKSKTASASPKK